MAAAQRSRTHCPAGHPYDEKNTCFTNGRRVCLQCGRDRRAAKRPAPPTDAELILSRMLVVGDCWEWIGARHNAGYGQYGRPPKLAHRWSYETFVGPIAATLTIDHLCRNRLCVNPAHLEPVPLATNVLRGESPPAKNARKTHCPKGHPYDETNTHVTSQGWRICKACNRERARKRHSQGG